VPAWHSVSAETHTMRHGNLPQRSVPARWTSPFARRDPAPSECRAAAGGHRPSGRIAAGPAAADRYLRAVQSQLVKHALDAVLLDRDERFAINACRAAVPFDALPRPPEDVIPPDPIHQGVKAPLRGSPGCDPESPLQLLHFVDPVALFVATITGTTTPSDARCARHDFAVGLYAPRCPDPGCADGPLVFRSSPCTRAAPPYPAETCRLCISGLRRGRRGLRRGVIGSALGL
jgi:hypothetical protein